MRIDCQATVGELLAWRAELQPDGSRVHRIKAARSRSYAISPPDTTTLVSHSIVEPCESLTTAGAGMAMRPRRGHARINVAMYACSQLDVA